MTEAQSISIHALLAESDHRGADFVDADRDISIHALLAESDNIEEVKITIFDISIHALLAESDPWPALT